jgi:pyruvate dehydrogenase E1 component beta subunit
LIIGRGWGQGPTHSQNLQSWFAHIPGLKVVMPTTATDAKGLLMESIFDPNPVVFLEHRWLHEMSGEVPEGDFRLPLGKARVLSHGKDLTVVSMSYMTVEAIHALEELGKAGIQATHIDLRSVNPIDWPTIMSSVKETGRLMVLDTGHQTCSVASEIVARVSTECFSSLKSAPQILALPDVPSPTSPALSEGYYKRAEDVSDMVSSMLGKKFDSSIFKKQRTNAHDVPGNWFKGPF